MSSGELSDSNYLRTMADKIFNHFIIPEIMNHKNRLIKIADNIERHEAKRAIGREFIRGLAGIGGGASMKAMDEAQETLDRLVTED